MYMWACGQWSRETTEASLRVQPITGLYLNTSQAILPTLSVRNLSCLAQRSGKIQHGHFRSLYQNKHSTMYKSVLEDRGVSESQATDSNLNAKREVSDTLSPISTATQRLRVRVCPHVDHINRLLNLSGRQGRNIVQSGRVDKLVGGERVSLRDVTDVGVVQEAVVVSDSEICLTALAGLVETHHHLTVSGVELRGVCHTSTRWRRRVTYPKMLTN